MGWQHQALIDLAFELGRARPDRCWVLTDFDTWHLNPFYQGEMQPHPESGFVPETNEERQERLMRETHAELEDDIHF